MASQSASDTIANGGVFEYHLMQSTD